MNTPPLRMPPPSEAAVDQRQLNGEGPGAYRHELAVTLPSGRGLPHIPWTLGEPGDTATWTEIEEMPDGSTVLRVVLATSASELAEDERGVMTGELAEAWWRLVSP